MVKVFCKDFFYQICTKLGLAFDFFVAVCVSVAYFNDFFILLTFQGKRISFSQPLSGADQPLRNAGNHFGLVKSITFNI
jgi:hypothetical protein